MMKLFSLLRGRAKVEPHILVALSDWCPACLEYKVVLNKVISTLPIKIVFVRPEQLRVPSIPTTLFVKSKKDTKMERGFMTYDSFCRKYNDFFCKID